MRTYRQKRIIILIPKETVTKARTLTIPKRGKERVKWLNVHTPRSIPGTSLQAAVSALGGPGWSWLPPRQRWTLPALSPAQRALRGSQWSGCWCTSSLGHHSFQLREGSQSSDFFLPKSSLAPSTPYHSPNLQTFLSSPPKSQGLDFQSQKSVFAARPERAAPTPGTFKQQPPAIGGSPEANTGELGSGEPNVNPGSSQGTVQSSAVSRFSPPRSSRHLSGFLLFPSGGSELSFLSSQSLSASPLASSSLFSWLCKVLLWIPRSPGKAGGWYSAPHF